MTPATGSRDRRMSTSTSTVGGDLERLNKEMEALLKRLRALAERVDADLADARRRDRQLHLDLAPDLAPDLKLAVERAALDDPGRFRRLDDAIGDAMPRRRIGDRPPPGGAGF